MDLHHFAIGTKIVALQQVLNQDLSGFNRGGAACKRLA